MQIGIVGIPYCGKTTVFNALTGLSAPTGKYSDSQGETNRGVVAVPDERIDRLTEMYRPKKKTYATVEFSDVAGFKKGAGSDSSLSSYLLGHLRDMDALAIVVRVFERSSVPHPENKIDPVNDLDILLSEFILSDLALAEKRCRKIGEQLGKGTQEDRDKLAHEKKVLDFLIQNLGDGQPIRSLTLVPEELLQIRGFGFLSQKPVLVIANVGDFSNEVEQERLKQLEKHCNSLNLPTIAMNADIECELRELDDPEERQEFLDAMGITGQAIDKVIQASYQVTHSMTFITAGEPEVRAWTILKDSRAIEAAAKIHSDIARGFIRAEVVSYEHLIQQGSIAKCRDAGQYREEGKDAIIHDGDVLYIRFNV